MTIRTKISLWYAGLLTLIIILFSVSIFGVIQAAIITSIDSELAQTSSNINRDVRVIPVGEFGALETGIVFRSEEIFDIPGIFVQVWQTSNGETEIDPVLVQSSPNLMGSADPLDRSYLSTDIPSFTNAVHKNIPQRVMTRSFSTVGGQKIGVIQIATSTLIIEQVNQVILTTMIIATGIGVVIAIGLGMMLSYRVMRPIQEITAAATLISTTNDLSTRLPDDLPDDEIGRLTKVFNHMMTRLEHLFGVRQRFVTDLSHELRTPLTAIHGNLDMIQRYGSDESSLQAIRQEADRMTRMVTEVLTLARADYGDIAIDLYPLDLDEVAVECLSHAPQREHAKGRDLTFKLGRHEPVHINGNYERLQQVIDNLMINAIKFTPDGGSITMAVYPQGTHGVIEIQDTGIGIAEENLDRIFQPFYQVDDSRTHVSDEDGAGLGLPIVKWIVEAHGGKIQVDSKVGEGTTFKITMPLMEKQENLAEQESHSASSRQQDYSL